MKTVSISTPVRNSGKGLGTGRAGGCQVSFEHNSRQPQVVEKENHILAEGVYEDWMENGSVRTKVELEGRFKELFKESVEKYNQKEKRNDRKIHDYLSEKVRGKKQHECYEMIVMVGRKLDNQQAEVTISQARKMLQMYMHGDETAGIKPWQERNPQMILVGCYFHADEINSGPHLHIDFIPININRDAKMPVRVGWKEALVASLKAENIDCANFKTSDSPANRWIKHEQDILQSICKIHDTKFFLLHTI